MLVQAEEVEDAEAMAEEGLLSAGKGPKPAAAAGGAAGLSHCLYIAQHVRCTSHEYTSALWQTACIMPLQYHTLTSHSKHMASVIMDVPLGPELNVAMPSS